MKTIKINFVDFWPGFNLENWFLYKILKKHYDVKISDNPDFLFCSCFSNDHEKYTNCIKIFYTGENILPDFNKYDYGIGFDYIDFGDRYFRRPVPVPKNINDRSGVTDDLTNRRFCNFIYHNANSGNGAVLRQEFCKKLMEYKHIDCPGRVLHNMDTDELEPRNGNWGDSKIEFLKKYKFTIAFENTFSDGYTTEKLIQPLQSLSVPIYMGNPLVVRDFNPRAFINANDYNNDFDAIIERVKYLDTHDAEYLAMLREKPIQPDFDFSNDKIEKWICDIIEKGNKPFYKDERDIASMFYKDTIFKLKEENNTLNTNVENLNQEKIILKTDLEKLNNENAFYKTQIDKLINNIEKINKIGKNCKKYFIVIFVLQIFFMILLKFL